MSVNEISEGFCIGFGGTNARTARCAEGDVIDFQVESTPSNTEDFFRWTSQQVLHAADHGASWVVAGFPGPVSAAGNSFTIGPFTNIPGLNGQDYDLKDELKKADPAAGEIFEQGFRLIAVNDGDLAAHAAATVIGEGQYDEVADIILGTGVGGAAVSRENDSVYRSLHLPLEIGHAPVGEVPTETFENLYSGNAIEAATGMEPELVPSDHPIWDKIGRGVGKMATLMSLMTSAELVVPSGSVGVYRYRDYLQSMLRFMDQYHAFGSPAQKNFEPLVKPVPTKIADHYELFGAEGVIRDELSRSATASV